MTAIIPSYNPCERILTLVLQLCQQKFTKIILVKDGSDERCLPIFRTLEKDFGCTVLTHPCNKGKGQALKTAFVHYLATPVTQLGVITLDNDDGQHSVDDVVACAKALVEHSNALVFGVRDFRFAHVPQKSKYGNRLTSVLLAMFCGLHITDTQTGLRAIPNCW
ncbi:MAG: glycosyltransferase family 2 protein, partial [Clostridia bacterium]